MDFKEIYWIGGSPCSGKSSISERLVKKYNFYLYKCDDFMEAHIKKGIDRNYKMISKISKMSYDELFSRPIEEQVRDTIEFYKEEFQLIKEDLGNIKTNRPILVEGSGVLPSELIDLSIPKNKSIFIVPTPMFQINNYRKRDWLPYILKQCQNPNMAFENWMKRDILYGKQIASIVKEHFMNLIIVDGKNDIEENLKLVLKHFKLN